MSVKTGWFADLADEDERDERWPWQAFLQLDGRCHPLAGVWFATREECETFIRDEIIGKGALK